MDTGRDNLDCSGLSRNLGRRSKSMGIHNMIMKQTKKLFQGNNYYFLFMKFSRPDRAPLDFTRG